MRMLEVQENLKGGYFSESDLKEIRVDYDVDGVRINKVVKAYHLGKNWYDLQEDLGVRHFRIGAWVSTEDVDGIQTVVVRGETK